MFSVMNAIGIEIVRERRLRAAVPAVLQYRGYCSRAAAARARERRLGLGALGTPAAGLRPRPAKEKGFPSNLLLD